MAELIRRTAHWLRLLLAPGTGTHRAGSRPITAPSAPRRTVASLPPHRSPYGLAVPLDATANRLVRPYLAANEDERALQHRRRLALVLAADFGIDLDRHLVGMPEVAV